MTDSRPLPQRSRFRFSFSPLQAADGPTLHQLVADCPPLDTNSLYCNLLQATHFGGTSMGAWSGRRLMGSITAYRLPDVPDTLFVWQVAVHPDARGCGLASQMLDELLATPGLNDIRYLHTTITPDNDASWALFRGWARRRHAETHSQVLFDRAQHLNDEHASEMLLAIGPLSQAKSDTSTSKDTTHEHLS